MYDSPELLLMPGAGSGLPLGGDPCFFKLSHKINFEGIRRCLARGQVPAARRGQLPYHPRVGKSALIGKLMPDLDKRAQAGRFGIFRIVALGSRLARALCFPTRRNLVEGWMGFLCWGHDAKQHSYLASAHTVHMT